MTAHLVYLVLCAFAIARAAAQTVPISCGAHPQSPIPATIALHQSIYSASRQSLFLFGGTTNSFFQGPFVDAVYKWDLSQAGSWFTQIGVIPNSTILAYPNNAVLIDNTAFFIGTFDDFGTLGKVYLFSLETEDWITPNNIQPPPDALANGCLANNATHIFMVAGMDETSNHRDSFIYIYEVASNQWVSVPVDIGLTEGGWHSQYCAVVDGQLYIFAGDTAGMYGLNFIANAYKMDCATLQIHTLPSLPQSRGYGRAVYLAHQRKIYLVGGMSGLQYISTILAFDLDTETYSDAGDTNPGVIGGAVEIVDGDLYVFAGEKGNILGLSRILTNVAQVCSLPGTNTPTASTLNPSQQLSTAPTRNPTDNPSAQPSSATDGPTAQTSNPSLHPSLNPSRSPTMNPSSSPTGSASTESTAGITLAAPRIPNGTSTTKETETTTAITTTADTQAADSDAAPVSSLKDIIWATSFAAVAVCVLCLCFFLFFRCIRSLRDSQEQRKIADRILNKEPQPPLEVTVAKVDEEEKKHDHPHDSVELQLEGGLRRGRGLAVASQSDGEHEEEDHGSDSEQLYDAGHEQTTKTVAPDDGQNTVHL